MRLGDFVWLAALGCVVLLLVTPATHAVFIAMTLQHPVLIGFMKFFVLATMGDLLAFRVVSGKWGAPVGLVYRALIWGILGCAITLSFEVFSAGVGSLIKKGLLPIGQGAVATFLTAFWMSTVMNLCFAPAMMGVHRITDTYIDLAEGKLSKIGSLSLGQVVGHIDWKGFISFVIFKTIPIFWIPAHTVTFLLPPEYRVLAAAFLGIVLGGILGFAKRRAVPAKAA